MLLLLMQVIVIHLKRELRLLRLLMMLNCWLILTVEKLLEIGVGGVKEATFATGGRDLISRRREVGG